MGPFMLLAKGPAGVDGKSFPKFRPFALAVLKNLPLLVSTLFLKRKNMPLYSLIKYYTTPKANGGRFRTSLELFGAALNSGKSQVKAN